DALTALKRTVANPSGLPPAMVDAMRSAKTMRPWSSSIDTQRTAVAGSKDSTKDSSSSPDTYWSQGKSIASAFASKTSKHKKETPPQAMGETLDDMLGYFEAKAKKEDEEAKSQGKKTWDQKMNDWWKNGSTFQRHEDLFDAVKAAGTSYMTMSPPSTHAPAGMPSKTSAEDGPPPVNKHDAHTRLLIPVLENLASYVQGPVEKRRDYFSQWTAPPEWAIDRNDNTSFYDKEPWAPPARVGRDPRYRSMGSSESTPGRFTGREPIGGNRYGVESVRFGAFGSPTATVGSGLAVGAGLERRFAFGRM
ncbi:hypothetical protein LTR53_013342, partial [Teratosphaeriaceae sp. CCFEE 6253]